MSSIMLKHAPADWSVKRLGQVFRERKEKVSDKIFTPLSVTKMGIVPQLESAAKSDDSDNRKGVRAGDFVINSRSDRKGSGGLSELDGSVSLINTVLKPRGIFPRFAHHLLRSTAFQEEFYRWGHGIVDDLWTTRYTEMKSILLALPGCKTQKKIADFLDQKIVYIDDLISEKRNFMASLIEKRQVLIAETVANNSNVSHADGEPSNWLKWSVNFVSARGREGCDPILPYIENEIIAPWTGELLEEPELKNAVGEHRFKSGDVLFNKLRPYLAKVHLAQFDGACSGELLCLRPSACVNSRYLLYFLLSPSFIDRVNAAAFGVKMPRANWRIIGHQPFEAPAIERQKQITDFLDAQTAPIDEAQLKVRESVKGLQDLRSAIITAAVTGQIDVTQGSKSHD